jgi:hypothetical protein
MIGFSLNPAMAVEVKAEAEKRGILLKELFAEMWHLYKNSRQAR